MTTASIGLDVGGSSTRAVAIDVAIRRATPIARAGSAHPFTVDADEADAVLRQVIDEAIRYGWSEPDDVAIVSVVASAAGLAPANVARLESSLRRACAAVAPRTADMAVDVRPDTEVAFAAAECGLDGIVLIAGTGSIAARVAAGVEIETADGHGWRFGDLGSGYWLGARVVRHALSSLDGSAPLDDLAMSAIGDINGFDPDPEVDLDARARASMRWQIISTTMSWHPSRVASLARHALSGDSATSGALVSEACDRLVATVDRLTPRPGEAIVLAGGLLSPGSPMLQLLTERSVTAGLVPHHVAEPVVGAARLSLLSATASG